MSPTLPLTLAEKLQKWLEAANYAEQWAEIEVTLRKELFNENFPAPKPGDNKMKVGLIGGIEMAMVGKYNLNYKLDRPGWESSVTNGLIPKELADKLVSYSPKVKDGAFRKLTDEELKKVSDFITETPGTPGLELKPAKGMRFT